jgi:hypothetical protein
MNKFTSAFVSVLIALFFVGCNAPKPEPVVACENTDGINAATAELAATLAYELHRWNVTADLEVYEDQGQRRLGVSAQGRAACGEDCPLTDEILSYQDPRLDQQIVLGDQKLKSSAFAARLVAGFERQVACEKDGDCVVPFHVLGPLQLPLKKDVCGVQYLFPVSGDMVDARELEPALTWADDETTVNPYISFQATHDSVSIDPTGIIGPGIPDSSFAICQKTSLTNINGTPCTCAANNIYSNGQLKNDDPLTAKTYYCRQM